MGQTAQIKLSKKQEVAIISSWKSENPVRYPTSILDEDSKNLSGSLKTILRVPWQFGQSNRFMRLSSRIYFLKQGKQDTIALYTNLTKPIFLFTLLGFLTTAFIIFPYLYINQIPKFYLFMLFMVISWAYIGLFFLKLKKFGKLYLENLVDKYN